ncbi:hypothetical protein EVAR_48038_1 [Eumeta japonica]|uniref:Uncharacterized protein n=1 Tax=Eumeta variegata TaxID=151549 RepID=A0A4C1XHP6_EUMVA|nr:hypothetical protein EVAR_48038_1 [Eumeta japonica]
MPRLCNQRLRRGPAQAARAILRPPAAAVSAARAASGIGIAQRFGNECPITSSLRPCEVIEVVTSRGREVVEVVTLQYWDKDPPFRAVTLS